MKKDFQKAFELLYEAERKVIEDEIHEIAKKHAPRSTKSFNEVSVGLADSYWYKNNFEKAQKYSLDLKKYKKALLACLYLAENNLGSNDLDDVLPPQSGDKYIARELYNSGDWKPSKGFAAGYSSYKSFIMIDKIPEKISNEIEAFCQDKYSQYNLEKSWAELVAEFPRLFVSDISKNNLRSKYTHEMTHLTTHRAIPNKYPNTEFHEATAFLSQFFMEEELGIKEFVRGGSPGLAGYNNTEKICTLINLLKLRVQTDHLGNMSRIDHIRKIEAEVTNSGATEVDRIINELIPPKYSNLLSLEEKVEEKIIQDYQVFRSELDKIQSQDTAENKPLQRVLEDTGELIKFFDNSRNRFIGFVKSYKGDEDIHIEKHVDRQITEMLNIQIERIESMQVELNDLESYLKGNNLNLPDKLLERIKEHQQNLKSTLNSHKKNFE